jgi:hypothetical protein
MPRRRWLEVLICAWIIAAQVWYYLQFRELFLSLTPVTLRRLWH